MEIHPLSFVILNVLIGVTLQHMNQPPGIPPKQQQHHHQAPSPQQTHGQGQPPAGQQNQDLHYQPHEGRGLRQQDVHNAEHIKEHLKEVVDKPKEEMTDEELEFHYFKLHDYDSNNKLDGIEITKAITHFHQDDDDDKDKEHKEHKKEPKIFTDSELSNIIDLVMKEDDFNNDGYIEYPEFVTAQRKNRAAEDEEDRKKRENTNT